MNEMETNKQKAFDMACLPYEGDIFTFKCNLLGANEIEKNKTNRTKSTRSTNKTLTSSNTR